MAKSGSQRRGRDAAPRRPGRPAAKRPAPAPARAKPARPASPVPATPVDDRPRSFVLGVVAGATPGKWISVWRERMPSVSLELEPLDIRDQHARVLADGLDAALVRLPLAADGLHVIPLYDEVAVVVTSVDSALTAADELTMADLTGEVHVVPRDDVYALTVPGTIAPRFAPPADTAEAIATVASGVGIVIVPMSLARLHRRKDTAYRPLRDGPTSSVGLAWRAEHTTPDVETFIGIVRGRTAHSSRD